MTDAIVAVLMMIVWAISLLYPWHPSWPYARWAIHLPWLLIPMFFLYEWLVPNEMNIRLDWLIIAGAFGFLFLVYFIRLIVFCRLRQSRAETDG